MKDLAIIVGTIALSITVLLAVVGGLFLFTTAHDKSTTDTCDMIQRIDGTLYCMAIMQAEDDNITVVRGEQNT